MPITINDELRQYIAPLTAHEYAALERSLLSEGCRDALVLWENVLVDGHNRYAICRKHGIDFKTVQHASFSSIDDVTLWMIDNQLGRRSVSDFQRGVLALRKRDIISARVKDAPEAAAASHQPTTDTTVFGSSIKTRDDIARVAGISSSAVGQIEKIRKSAAPELVDAVRAGTISINAAAAVASLPGDAQVAAVAGGRKTLQQAAKRVRETKVAHRIAPGNLAPASDPVRANATDNGSDDDPASLRATIAQLNATIAMLTAENQRLQVEIAGLRGQVA